MKPAAPWLAAWPQVPPLPPPAQPVLVRVETAAPRAVARRQVREVARRILAAWSGDVTPAWPWRETPRGPVAAIRPGGHPVALSFSYSAGAGWIGFLRGGKIGVDAMRIEAFAGMEAVAGLYLGPAAVGAMLAADDPARAFALAWTEREATLKCERRELSEWQEGSAARGSRIDGRHIHCHADTVVTVVTAMGARASRPPLNIAVHEGVPE